MNKDNKELKDTDLKKVNGGLTVNEGEFIQGTPFASGVRPAEPVIIKPEYKKKEEEKDTLVPIPY